MKQLSHIYKIEWTSPSNIALIKYWGKHGVQLPKNPSISFSLNESVTTMSITVLKAENSEVDFIFEGKSHSKFKEKIEKFLSTQLQRFPWLKDVKLVIESKNTFPHSSGIASSASSMSALCLCLLSIDEYVTQNKKETTQFLEEASHLARLASGSASRSLYPGLVSWGACAQIQGSSDLHATPYKKVHPIFLDYCDSILIVDSAEKSVSSRAGHALMENHPFAKVRFDSAHKNMERLLKAIEAGDVNTFIEIVELEALSLHALMMTSSPSYILLKAQSLQLIEHIRNYRSVSKIPVCFTIDAGPNIHLLYPNEYKLIVRSWVEKDLRPFLDGIKWIHDHVGSGPIKNLENLNDSK